jgi:glyoxylase-like metal-dependent hydrolase (beta-lactamase superfamily II)
MTAPYDFSDVRLTLPNSTFREHCTLSVGGREVVLNEIGPAHTDGDTIVYVPDAGVVFTGDLVFVDSTPVMWGGPIENWLHALTAIVALDPKVIVPGHGPLTTSVGVARVRDYLEFVLEQATRHHRHGLSAKAAAYAIAQSGRFRQLGFAEWDSPERVMTTAYSIYRQLGTSAFPAGTPGLLRVMAEQAELAFEFPAASPRLMHQL